MIFEIASLVLMSLGCVVMFSAAVAIIRFPDVYMRLHASAKASTGGTLTLLAGVLLRTGFSGISTKIIVVIVLILFTGPILSHAIARVAYIKGGLQEEVPFEDVEDMDGSEESEGETVEVEEDDN